MKNLRWKLDISHFTDADTADPKAVFSNFLIGALRLGYKDGLGREFQRRLFKIQDKLDKASTDLLELEDAEFDMVKEAFERAKFQPEVVKTLNQIYDFIEEAGK